MNNKITNDEITTELLNQLKSSVIASEDTITISATTDDYYIYSNSNPSINWDWNTTTIPNLSTDTINWGWNTTTIPTLSTDIYNQIYKNPILSSPSIFTNQSDALNVIGDANFEGDIKIKGKSILDSLEKIEEKLAILRPNEQLEEKWERLRELRKEYIDLERDIVEKEKIWETLKK